MIGSTRWSPDSRAGALRAGIATLDRRFAAWAAAWTVASLLGLGLVAAIIPNPVFGRMIAVEPFAVVTWLLSAPLLGLLAATWTAPAVPGDPPTALGSTPATLGAMPAPSGTGPAMPPDPDAERGSAAGTIGGIGVFFAIGCPICNKIALVLLGTSGALNIFAPIQPILGAASLILLVATLAWRITLRARPAACPV